ncbi:hypothetical protein ACF0HZ_11035 (plasmid) [Leuconostoc suionicum]|uniref:hypothetical protein n=1 Tax=Leuconostoc suionicum TaxID=1511761 RepID=UPI003748A719
MSNKSDFFNNNYEYISDETLSEVNGGSWIGKAIGNMFGSLGNGMDDVNHNHTTIQGYIPGISKH